MQISLGKTYRELGNLDLALQAFRRAVMLVPNSYSAHNNVGSTYMSLGNCDQAVYELTQAAKLNPEAIDAVANLAISLYNCGNAQESIPYFEQVLAMPESLNVPGVYTYAARAYLQVGNFDEAVKRAQQGALLPPVTADAYYYLGQAYEGRKASGDDSRAKEAYQKSLEINPDFQLARDALSRLP
jgi:tetratricopeptide (TPR) repeat protein